MQLDQNSFYRNKITPWYDSTFVCWVIILMAVAVLIFGFTGILVAAGDPLYKAYLWLPCLLSVFSLILVITISIRLIKRNKAT